MLYLGILLAAKSVNNEDEDKDAIEAAEARGSCSGNPHHVFPVSLPTHFIFFASTLRFFL